MERGKADFGRGGLLDHSDAASEEKIGFVAVDLLDLLVDVVG